MLKQALWGFPHSGTFWKRLKLCVSGRYIPLSSGETAYCWRSLVQAASLSCTDVEVGAQRAKGWPFDGHNRSENTDWDDGGAALHVWEMGTWWDWLEEEMCDSQGLWNGAFPLSTVQARFLQCCYRHAVSVSSWPTLNQDYREHRMGCAGVPIAKSMISKWWINKENSEIRFFILFLWRLLENWEKQKLSQKWYKYCGFCLFWLV